jgi:hypothetical protein
MEPFLFRRYGEVIGVAHNVDELEQQLTRLAKENPQAAEYHLREGHVADWLTYIGRGDLANRLKGVSKVDEAIAIIGDYRRRGAVQEEPSATTSQSAAKHRKRKRGQHA